MGEVGGNTLGFFGAVCDDLSKYILGTKKSCLEFLFFNLFFSAHGYTGAFHLWRRSSVAVEEGSDSTFKNDFVESSKRDDTGNIYVPIVPISGHSDQVLDLSWDKNGDNYLLSVR